MKDKNGRKPDAHAYADHLAEREASRLRQTGILVSLPPPYEALQVRMISHASAESRDLRQRLIREAAAEINRKLPPDADLEQVITAHGQLPPDVQRRINREQIIGSLRGDGRGSLRIEGERGKPKIVRLEGKGADWVQDLFLGLLEDPYCPDPLYLGLLNQGQQIGRTPSDELLEKKDSGLPWAPAPDLRAAFEALTPRTVSLRSALATRLAEARTQAAGGAGTPRQDATPSSKSGTDAEAPPGDGADAQTPQ